MGATDPYPTEPRVSPEETCSSRLTDRVVSLQVGDSLTRSPAAVTVGAGRILKP
jgi:hypothetical protein